MKQSLLQTDQDNVQCPTAERVYTRAVKLQTVLNAPAC
jgi:hypothetical protein